MKSREDINYAKRIELACEILHRKFYMQKKNFCDGLNVGYTKAKLIETEVKINAINSKKILICKYYYINFCCCRNSKRLYCERINTAVNFFL